MPRNSEGDQKMGILSDKIKILNARAADVRKELEHAEIQPGKKQRAEVHQWLISVEGKIMEFQSFEREGHQEQLTGCTERFIKEVDELIHQGRFPYELVLHDHDSTRLPLLLSKPAGEMFELYTRRIMGWLNYPLQYVLGVYGMGGVGKTTLLMKIHDQLLQDCNIFGPIYWVTVSQNCSTYKLQHDIARVVGLDLPEEKDEMKRAAVLYNRLIKMGKMILVLDDMWESFLTEEIGIPLGHNSCKIILSTRNLEVCRRMGCADFIVQVERLSRIEAWNLFIDKLNNYEALAIEVEELAEEVAMECSGLPLAIITVAGSMRGVLDVQEWQNALDELRNPNRRQYDMENHVFSRLKFSYDRLNDETLKHCFLSCVLYPEDMKIRRQILIDLWIWEGLLEDAGSREEQLNKGHTNLNKLVYSCLLESTITRNGEKFVRMHDLIRDMAVFITQSQPHFIAKPRLLLREVPEENHWTEDLVKVSLGENEIEELPCDMSPKCPKLTVLMLYHNPLMRIQECFFVHMRALTILDLSWTHIERVPDSVSNLETLRALFLKGCDCLTYVPSVAKLTKLRVLDLPDSWITEFKAPRGMESLKSLERLDCCMWRISDLTYFNRLMQTWQFRMLRRYHFILCDYEWDNLRDLLRGGNVDHCYDKKVSIIGVSKEEELTCVLLPVTIQWLSISDCECDMEGRRSVGDWLPSLGVVAELKVLRIESCKGLEYVWWTPPLDEDKFILSQLEWLYLYKLPNLQGIIRLGEFPSASPPPVATFSHLKRLHICECPNMKAVFQQELIQQQPLFPNLESIFVWECGEVEEVFESPRNTNFVLALPKLRLLRLYHLPTLRCVYRGLLLCNCQIHIEIDNCPQLAELVPLLKYGLICDASPSSLASLPTCTDNPRWWEALHKCYPEDAVALSYFVNQVQPTDPGNDHEVQLPLSHFSDHQRRSRHELLALSPKPHFSDDQDHDEIHKRKRE